MKVKTKLNPGDKCYLIYNDKLECTTVLSILISISNTIDISYNLDITRAFSFAENKVFKTKQNLLDSL